MLWCFCQSHWSAEREETWGETKPGEVSREPSDGKQKSIHWTWDELNKTVSQMKV